MWVTLFTVVFMIAVALSLAAVVADSAEGRKFRL